MEMVYAMAQLTGKCMPKRAWNCLKGGEKEEEEYSPCSWKPVRHRQCLAVLSKSRLPLAICCKSFALQSQQLYVLNGDTHFLHLLLCSGGTFAIPFVSGAVTGSGRDGGKSGLQ